MFLRLPGVLGLRRLLIFPTFLKDRLLFPRWLFGIRVAANGISEHPAYQNRTITLNNIGLNN